MRSLRELFSGIQVKNTAITPQEAHQMMRSSNDYILLDVRTPNEYKQRHIDGAKLIPVDDLSVRAAVELPDKQTPVLIYCQSGARAGRAVKILTEAGYTKARSIGSIMNWPYGTVKE